jgi:NAD(P)-dependent dehydrogenase (short-subunit alcohol dehydrogenase family)
MEKEIKNLLEAELVLVTGGSSGIGRATAVVMAREDAAAVIMRRRTTAPLTHT